MPTLKKRSRKGVAERLDVGVFAEIRREPDDLAARLAEPRSGRVPNGASTAGAGRLPASSWPMASVRLAGALIAALRCSCSNSAMMRVPLADIDAEEVRLLARLDARDALAGQGAQDDRLGLAVAACARRERADDRRHVVAVDLG